MDVSEKTRITRRIAREMQEAAAASPSASTSHGGPSSSFSSSSTGATSSSVVRGCFHCICRSFFMSHADDMLECVKCRNWSHALCMEVDPTRLPAVRHSFVCMHCTGEAAARRKRASSSSAAARSDRRPDEPPKVVLQKLSEVPDRTPANVAALTSALHRLVSYAGECGFDLIFTAHDAQPMSDAMAEQALACCASAIQSATFSESYPTWCLNELRSPPHKYLQGTFMRCRATHRIVSLVLSNGQDVYGSLRSTITQIRVWRSRAAGVAAAAAASGGATAAPVQFSPFVEACLNITDVSPFVHLNLIATHPSFRGRGLAKMVIAAELLRWAIRGRRQVYLNMALDKALDGRRVVCSVSPASKRLYDMFGFQTVFQRSRLRGGGGRCGDEAPSSKATVVSVETTAAAKRNGPRGGGGSTNTTANVAKKKDHAEGKVVVEDEAENTDGEEGEEERFTAKEADMGRVLANLDYVDTVLNVVGMLSRGHADVAATLKKSAATTATTTSGSAAAATAESAAAPGVASAKSGTEVPAAKVAADAKNAAAAATTKRKRNGAT